MATNYKCEVDPTHFTDLHGCLDCFMEECNRLMWEDIINEESHVKSTKDLKGRNGDNI